MTRHKGTVRLVLAHRVNAMLALAALLSTEVDAKISPTPAKTTEIRVTLFGQPCQLNGPFPEATLVAIHSISPEKTPPPRAASQAKELVERVRKTTGLPAELDRYREKLTRHFEAQAAFHDGLSAAKKAGKAEPFTTAVRDHLIPRKAEGFLAKVDAKMSPAQWSASSIDVLAQAYTEAVEPHPEEEFHRAIQRLNVRYACTFEENVGEGEGEE